MWVVWSTIILPPGLVSYSSFSNIFHPFGVLFSEFFILAAKKFNSQEPPFFLLFLLFSSLCSGKVKVTQACPSLCDPMDYTVHGILQARILEWVAFSFSRGSSQPRDWTQVSRLVGRFFTNWAMREELMFWGTLIQFCMTAAPFTFVPWSTNFHFFHIFSKTCHSLFFCPFFVWNSSHTLECKVLIRLSLMTCDVEHLSICSLVRCISSAAMKLKDACSLEVKLWPT